MNEEAKVPCEDCLKLPICVGYNLAYLSIKCRDLNHFITIVKVNKTSHNFPSSSLSLEVNTNNIILVEKYFEEVKKK